MEKKAENIPHMHNFFHFYPLFFMISANKVYGKIIFKEWEKSLIAVLVRVMADVNHVSDMAPSWALLCHIYNQSMYFSLS